jgi:hypothetical protein
MNLKIVVLTVCLFGLSACDKSCSSRSHGAKSLPNDSTAQTWNIRSKVFDVRDNRIMDLQNGGVAIDVSPKQWDGPDRHHVNRCGPSGINTLDGGEIQICNDDSIELVHHMTCTEKSRFLMASEDGKWHCLALGKP